MQKSTIVRLIFLLIFDQYLTKNNLIILSILFEMDSVSLFSILFGMHYLIVLLNIFELQHEFTDTL